MFLPSKMMIILPALLILTLHDVALGRPLETADEDDFLKFEFKSYDADGDNKISAEEVRAFYQSSEEGEAAQKEAVFSMAAFDDDVDGSLNEGEFRLWFDTHPDEAYSLAYDKILFRAMDKDGDKSIQKGEYRNVLTLWAYADGVIEKYVTNDFNQFDTDKDDEWNFEEFRMWDDSPSSEEELRDDFDAEDKDEDGFVSEEEMRMDSMSIGAPEIAELAHVEFMEADSDGDGRVSFGEYAAFFL